MPSERLSPSRRRWLESVGLLALGSGLATKAFQTRNFPDLRASSSLPPEPPTPAEQLVLDSTPSNESETQEETPTEAPLPPDYALFLARFDFRYIKPREVINPHYRNRNGVKNTLPPPELWRNMPASLFVADEIRHRLGKPLKLITSAYRTPAYNQQCGGAPQSWHTKNNALDLVFEGGPKEAHAIALQLREEGFFKGGVGFYQSFIHIDTRGRDATWRA